MFKEDVTNSCTFFRMKHGAFLIKHTPINKLIIIAYHKTLSVSITSWKQHRYMYYRDVYKYNIMLCSFVTW